MSEQTTGNVFVEHASRQERGDQRKKEEFRTWLFLALVLAPVLAVLTVSGFGFVVWFYQLIAGPPTV
jgi:periplasmic nitrate reductase NapE